MVRTIKKNYWVTLSVSRQAPPLLPFVASESGRTKTPDCSAKLELAVCLSAETGSPPFDSATVLPVTALVSSLSAQEEEHRSSSSSSSPVFPTHQAISIPGQGCVSRIVPGTHQHAFHVEQQQHNDPPEAECG